MFMPRATLIAASDSPEEMSALEEWLSRWRDSLSYLSDDTGCGCCVHIYDVDGPQEAVDAIPSTLSAMSDWTEGKR